MTTRKGFLFTSGATLTALARPSVGFGRSTTLDAEFVRTEAPPISLQYPRGLYLIDRVMTDLIEPIQLFALSNRPLSPHHSLDGIANLKLFPRSAAILTCMASAIIPGETDLSNAHSLEAGVRFADFDGGMTDDSGSGFATYGQWYAANDFVYMFFLWVGPAAKDWDAIAAAIETIRFSA